MFELIIGNSKLEFNIL